jgi:hypothetical protein
MLAFFAVTAHGSELSFYVLPQQRSDWYHRLTRVSVLPNVNPSTGGM